MGNRNFSALKTVVIKLGTNVMTGSRGQFSNVVLKRLARQIADVKRGGLRVIVVSSGSIGLGMKVLGLKRRPKELAALQAAAAVGQGKLMHLYEAAFSRKGFHTAQVLLTRDEFTNRKLYVNAHRTLTELLARGVIPIINENDTIATQEIQLGDNDTLAALVGESLKADLTVLLSDVDGFFLKNGTRVDCITGESEVNELEGHLYRSKREHTRGGMATKLRAAKMLLHSGLSLLIANGKDPVILEKIFRGENVGTLFLGSGKLLASRKSWLAHSARVHGSLVIDAGAEEAVKRKGKSLLASGVRESKGSFRRGDVVHVLNSSGSILGVGKINYSSPDLKKILGKKSNEITKILGLKCADEVIHRNHWAPLGSA